MDCGHGRGDRARYHRFMIFTIRTSAVKFFLMNRTTNAATDVGQRPRQSTQMHLRSKGMIQTYYKGTWGERHEIEGKKRLSSFGHTSLGLAKQRAAVGTSESGQSAG